MKKPRKTDIQPASKPLGYVGKGTHGASDPAATLDAVDLFHDTLRRPYAAVRVNGQVETWPVASPAFSDWLTHEHWLTHQRPLGARHREELLELATAKARFDGTQHPVHYRLAHQEGDLWIDLADERRRTVKVTGTGWQILDACPVRFSRPPGMRALPEPAPGGKVSDLLPLLNLNSEDDGALVLAWLLGAYHPGGPYPLLCVNGEQGSGKSTLTALLGALIDPRETPDTAMPRADADFLGMTRESRLKVLDNLSVVPAAISDVLCRLSTGTGCGVDLAPGTPTACPVILNGIPELIARPDLLDRSIFVELPAIAGSDRRTASEVRADFDKAKAGIFGGLLDAVSMAMGRVADTKLEHCPRMAEFTYWVVAAGDALGLPPGRFLDAYTRNRDDADRLAISASPIGQPILDLMAEEDAWSGTAENLLATLDARCQDPKALSHRDWPTTAQRLSHNLRRLVTSLGRQGILVEFTRTDNAGRARLIRLRKSLNEVSKVSKASKAKFPANESPASVSPAVVAPESAARATETDTAATPDAVLNDEIVEVVF